MGTGDFDDVLENVGRFLWANAYVAVPPLAVASELAAISQTEVAGSESPA